MKKGLLVIAILAIVMTCCQQAYAVDMFATDVELTDRWNFGINTSAVVPKESELGTGIQVQGLLSYDIYQFLAIGVETGWTGALDVESSGLDFGTLNAWSVLGDIILKAPIEAGDYVIVPFFLTGVGGIFPWFDESSTLSDAGFTVDYKSACIFKLGGGVDFYVTDTFSLTFETSYQWAEVDVTAKQNGVELASGSDDLDAWYVGGGLKLKFG